MVAFGAGALGSPPALVVLAFDGWAFAAWAFDGAGCAFDCAGWAFALGAWALAGAFDGAWAFECVDWDFDWDFTGCVLDCDFVGWARDGLLACWGVLDCDFAGWVLA